MKWPTRRGFTEGPLEVGYYTPTEKFLAVREHVAVMKPNGQLIATTGPAGGNADDASHADARLFAVSSDLLAFVQRYIDSGDGCIRGGDSDPATCDCITCDMNREARSLLERSTRSFVVMRGSPPCQMFSKSKKKGARR